MSSRMNRTTLLAFGVLGVVLAQVDPAYATTVPPTPVVVPEISGASLSTGLAALTGGLLILRAWWRR